ncbi:hypothetical protein FGF1_40560 [Flavobacteriaceae bacterium GF1]
MAFYHPLKNYTADPDYSNKQSWISSRLLTLRHDLYLSIEKDRHPDSLIVGSWNIRAFDGGMPRMDESYHYIAEIIDHFDICAVQEIKKDLWPLRRLKNLLGPNWDFFVSDISTHKGGNNERMAFVYNRNKVFFRNLIGEIVLPREDLIAGEQIARSPFFASFQAGWFKFSLCSAHIIFGDDLGLRAAEIKAVTDALVKRSKSEDQVHIFLGDMNIESEDGEVMKAFKESKLTVPDFGPTNMGGDKWFDQIAFTVQGKASRKTRLIRHGAFDWRHSVYGPHPRTKVPDFLNLSPEDEQLGKKRLTKEEMVNHYEPVVRKFREKYDKKPHSNFSNSYGSWATHEISDHLPIWIELEIDYSDDYLRRFL